MTEPTDAELDELRQANSGRLNFVTFSEFRTIARAVLAKWGTPPAVAGEPVACRNCGGTGWMVRDPDIGTDQECFVYDGRGGYSESATPQPTQAQAGAVPLTDEQIEAATGAKIGTPLFLAAKGFVLATEAAHGIKGGQHGADI